MRFTYTTSSLTYSHTALVDDYQRYRYHIFFATLKSKVTIEKLVDDTSATSELAVIKLAAFSSDTITWNNGCSLNVKDWLKRPSKWSNPNKRTFTSAKTGALYEWKTQGAHWILLNHALTSDDSSSADLLPGKQVARSHNQSLGIIGHEAHKPYIEIDDEVLEDLDEIIVSFVYVRTTEEIQQAANAGSS